MKKIAMILAAAGLLAICGCSKSPEEDQKPLATPDPKLSTRMEEQQNAINRAAEQMKREAEQKGPATIPTPTPSASPP